MNTNIMPPNLSALCTTNFKNIPLIKQLTAVQSTQMGSRTLEPAIEGIYACHATSFFPNHGIIHPRMTYEISLPSAKLKSLIEKLFSILRPSVHFTLNSVVSSHKDYPELDKASYVIIDKLNNAKDQIAGGYAEDIFSIGPYKLSDEAVILAPESARDDQETQQKMQTLSKNIQIIYYKGDTQVALTQWLQNQKTNYFYGVMSDPNIPNYFHKLGNDRFISSQSLMETLQKPFCTHDVTPMAQLENYIGAFSISSAAPFLNISKTVVFKTILLYTSAIKNSFSINSERFINAYEKTILLALEILSTAKTEEEIEERLKRDEKLITHYDTEEN
ncbi:MAG: hypothetical protein LLG04_04600 [Parachlamydia sp.]|nr:hypothetical protein [Parachlamydia sp.]